MKMLPTMMLGALLLGPTGPARAQPPPTTPGPPGGRAWLGIAMAPLTAVDRRQKGVPRYGGVLIQSVMKRSPAATAGFQPGDVVMRIDNKYIYTAREIIRKIARKKVGDRIKIDIIRNSKWMSARVRLTARPRRIPGHPGVVRPPFPRPPGWSGPGWPGARQGAILNRLKALEKEVRLLRQAIEQLKSVCRPRRR